MKLLLLAAIAALSGVAQQRPLFPIPDDIDYRQARIQSEGTSMAAGLFSAKALSGRKLPVIVMSHGWGGVAASLRREAVSFAKAGYFVVTFDYRGWGASDSRVILASPKPTPRPEEEKGNRFTAEVREIREVVDPMDMAADILNAIHWVQSEPQCDPNRIGLWGSSFSGGLVVWAAAHDPRVRALHSQVPALDGRWVASAPDERKKTYEESTRRARGEIGYPAPREQVIGNLRGAPIRSRFVPYYPVEIVHMAPRCAMQFVLAEKEELFDNRDHGVKAHERAIGPKRLVSIPNITHYGIYGEARGEAERLAIEWFDKHLKN